MILITPQVYRRIGSKAAGLLSVKTGLSVPEFYVSNPNAAVEDSSQSWYHLYHDKWLMTRFDKEIKFFSVRSSSPLEDRPNTTMAGRFESHINVPRERVMDTVVQVRESMRALHTKLGQPDLDCPVIIQAMVWGMPGIVFTRGSVKNTYSTNMLKSNPWLADMTYEFYPKITNKTTVDEMGVGGKVEPKFTSYSENIDGYPGELLFSYLEFVSHLIHKDLEVVWTWDTKQQMNLHNQLVLLQCRSITA